MPNKGVALDRAGITVFSDITSLAAGPASERCRSLALDTLCGTGSGECEKPQFHAAIKYKSQSRERLSYVGKSLLRLSFGHASLIHAV